MKPIATNKKAYRNYFLTETWECGIVLSGGEVKSCREGQVNFKDTYAQVDKEEMFLYSLHISPYKQASYLNEDPDRPRKLLMHKKEIKRLIGLQQQKSMTLIPTKIYFNKRGLIKVEIALGTGKKLYDKREDIKRKTSDMEMQRALRHRS